MKKYEFDHIRMTHGVEGELSKNLWEEKIEKILAEMGEKGWDLKSFSYSCSAHSFDIW